MVSRRQEFKALGKWMCQLRPIGKEYKFKVIAGKGKEIEIGVTGLESGCASVGITPVPLVYSEKHLFKLISLFDEKKITLDEVIRLRKLVHAQAESGKK